MPSACLFCALSQRATDKSNGLMGNLEGFAFRTRGRRNFKEPASRVGTECPSRLNETIRTAKRPDFSGLPADVLVGARGFEPPTPRSRTESRTRKCASKQVSHSGWNAFSMPIVSGPQQTFGVASATEEIQENARRHDADALKLLDRQKIWIAGHDHRRATFDCRGKILVIVCVYADAARPRSHQRRTEPVESHLQTRVLDRRLRGCTCEPSGKRTPGPSLRRLLGRARSQTRSPETA